MKQAKVLTEAEIKRLLAIVADSRYAARNRFAIVLSYFAGMRVGEIASLQHGDVFHADGTVKEQIRLKAEHTKTNEARTLFMSGKLKKEAERYFESLDHERSVSAPLLMTQKRTAFSANTLCQLFKELYKAAAIDGGSSHSGRRWFITRLAHSGVSAKVIMTLAGHKHLSTTQRYIEVNDEMMKAAVEIL